MTKEKALQKLQSVKTYMTSGNPIWDVAEMAEAFDMAIEALSTSEPELKMGRWMPSNQYINQYGRFMGKRITFPDVCSVCGRSALNEPWAYCPNCGSKMERQDV